MFAARLFQFAGWRVYRMQNDITLRTKSDGSLARILLQPGNLNPMLPPSEMPRVGLQRINMFALFFCGHFIGHSLPPFQLRTYLPVANIRVPTLK